MSSYQKSEQMSPEFLRRQIAVASGEEKADLVIKNVHFLDVFSGTFRKGDVACHAGQIIGIVDAYDGRKVIDGAGLSLVPGFIDSHVHIESSLMTPRRFQQACLPCGTTSVIWDPHEIANVLGKDGIAWAIEESEGLLLDVFVMLPSCVPSTNPELGFETSGAQLGVSDLLAFKDHPRVLGLAEMMNFPGVLAGEVDPLAKLSSFSAMRRDGHCPSLSGRLLNAYALCGIHSCHESTNLEEAQEKMTKGIHLLIREGSCAKDARTLFPLLNPYSSATVAYCTDDRNPYDIAKEGHISAIINIGLKMKLDPVSVFRSASYAAAKLYGLEDRGAIAPGYKADLVLLRARDQEIGFESGFEVLKTFKNGTEINSEILAAQNLPNKKVFSLIAQRRKNLNLNIPNVQDFEVKVPTKSANAKRVGIRVIEVIPNQILTKGLIADLEVKNGKIEQDIAQDFLKIAVFERHHGSGKYSVGFVKGFHLREGAIATSINHDSHNVIVVGASDESMHLAVARLQQIDGGIVVIDGKGKHESLALSIAGLMTDEEPKVIAEVLGELKTAAKHIGCQLDEPFLTLSFLALPVIPELKITDCGLIDVKTFRRVNPFTV